MVPACSHALLIAQFRAVHEPAAKASLYCAEGPHMLRCCQASASKAGKCLF